MINYKTSHECQGQVLVVVLRRVSMIDENVDQQHNHIIPKMKPKSLVDVMLSLQFYAVNRGLAQRGHPRGGVVIEASLKHSISSSVTVDLQILMILE